MFRVRYKLFRKDNQHDAATSVMPEVIPFYKGGIERTIGVCCEPLNGNSDDRFESEILKCPALTR